MPCRYRAGIPWRDLPARFGDFQVARLHHSRWSHSGVWQRIFEALAQQADNEYAMIGSTIVRAHQHGAGAERGGAASHRTQPRRAERQMPKQANGLEGADVLLAQTAAETVITNKDYDAQARVLELLPAQGKGVVIASCSCKKAARDYDPHLYQARHLIENFFARLKQYWAIVTRYDKTARNLLGAIHLAAAGVWLA